MSRHSPADDAREIDADHARGRTIGTTMTGDEWLATHAARRRYVQRVGVPRLCRMTIAEIDDAVRAEHARTPRR